MSSFRSRFSFPLFFLGAVGLVHGQTTPAPATDPADAPVSLDKFVVTDTLDRARQDIVPSLGATSYEINSAQIGQLAQGVDASFNEVLLRAPGVAQDSFGQVHVRGEHANLQYRINDVLLPEGISGFGQELDTRFVDSLSVLTGSLPAQYGYRTSGIVDIHTKSGALAQTNSIAVNGGSFGTVRPSLETGGSAGPLTYYFNASYEANDLGIENPTPEHTAIHDRTRQFKTFTYLSWLIDPSSRLNLIASGSTSKFQIPNNPNQDPAFTLQGVAPFNSAALNENQSENNAYTVLAYQKTAGLLSFQVAAFNRYSGVHFTPDQAGDLIFNGVASDVNRGILSQGVELDSSWAVTDTHTLRAGILATVNRARTNTATAVFPVDDDGEQTSSTPFTIFDPSKKRSYLYGLYVQDEWKLTKGLTLNYGLRADGVKAYLQEGQTSPRVNLVYVPVEGTSFHVGYARYFTPPPLELVQSSSVQRFDGTSNASEISTRSAVRSERSHYFDAGVSHQLSPELSVGLDGYYKSARNLLDEGQFGQALIFSPFNYDRGKIYGAELTGNYTKGKFTAYANLAVSHATAERIISGEFQFDPDELAYIANHDVFLDHDQRYTASTGASYHWHATSIYADLLYGSGLRRGFANTEKLPASYPFNMGIEHSFTLSPKQKLRARFDVVNVFDQSYELRDGSGIGVGAPQFGSRRAFYGSLSWTF